MTINPDAIERFRRQGPLWVPAFKGMSRDSLESSIYACTGLDFRPFKPSRTHQTEATAFALYCRQSLLFFEPRVGKTKTALDWAEHLKRAGLWKGKGIVIAHKPVGVDVWEHEASLWSRLKVTGILSDREPRETFIRALTDDTDLIVIPWGMLRSMFTIRRLNRKDEMREYPDRDMLRMVADHLSLAIIDEVHYCKNPFGLYFDIASELVAKCAWRLGLTGTPVGRDAMALWAQCFLIDGGETLGYNYQFFEAVFCKKRKNKHHPKGESYVFDQDNLPAVLDKVSGLAMSYRLDEIQDVNVMSGVVELRMYGEQRAAYNDIIERFSSGEFEESNIKNTFHRMRQIASGFMPYIDEQGNEHVVPFESNPKLEWLSDLIDTLPADIPVVIFHEYVRSGEMISDMLTAKKREHVCFNGRTKDRTIVRQFQSGEVNIMVANTMTGSEAIDLRRAEYLCFYESSCSPITRKQAESRPLARGSRPLLIDDLICSPVEQRILDMIAQGRDLQQALTSIRHVMKDKAR